MRLRRLAGVQRHRFPVLLALLLGCFSSPPLIAQPAADDSLLLHARRIARDILILDAHIDLPSRLRGSEADVSLRTPDGHFDHPRAVAGGLKVAFMAVYVPASLEGKRGAREHADELIGIVEGLAARRPDRFALARSVAEVRERLAPGVVVLPLGMENGAPLAGKLVNVRYYYDRGIRYITLAHSKNNHICDSSYDEKPRWKGLSPFGRKLIGEMNRLGIMIDVSHVSDSAFYQVLRLSLAPVIASHSGCRRFTPGWERNMSDDMIRLLAAKGGVIHIVFGSMFLRDENRRGGKTRAGVADVARHIDHAVRIAGVDHVGLGSDFDGVDGVPEGLEDVSGYPNLLHELLKMGYSEEDLRKICGENTLRVWEAVESAARREGK